MSLTADSGRRPQCWKDSMTVSLVTPSHAFNTKSHSVVVEIVRVLPVDVLVFSLLLSHLSYCSCNCSLKGRLQATTWEWMRFVQSPEDNEHQKFRMISKRRAGIPFFFFRILQLLVSVCVLFLKIQFFTWTITQSSANKYTNLHRADGDSRIGKFFFFSILTGCPSNASPDLLPRTSRRVHVGSSTVSSTLIDKTGTISFFPLRVSSTVHSSMSIRRVWRQRCAGGPTKLYTDVIDDARFRELNVDRSTKKGVPWQRRGRCSLEM